MTANSPIVLRIHLKSSERPKAMSAPATSSTRTTSSASCASSKAACTASFAPRKRPSGMSKEMRRERNRITARESRDRKAAYVAQLETEVRRLNERVAQLEYDLATHSMSSTTTTTTLFSSCPSFFCDDLGGHTPHPHHPDQMITTAMIGGFFDP